LFTVSFQEDYLRNNVQEVLAAAKISATVYYDPPVHRTPYYQRFTSTKSLPNTDWASKHVLSLPVHSFVGEKELEHIRSGIENTI
jgi:dTDP-4-amino-4,6-dideoxygalactose transaminase